MRTLFENWENPVSQNRLELVFAHRNQEYGAYALRKNYDKTILRAFIITCFVGFALAISPRVKDYLFPAEIIGIGPDRSIVVDLIEPDKIIKPEEVKKEETATKDPNTPTQRDVVPIVVNHNTNDTTLTQDELSKTNTGTKTVKGDTTITDPKPNLDPDPKPIVDNNIHSGWVEVMPAFPGGEAAMMQYIGSHIHYPELAKESNVQGTVYITFVVNKNGEITDIETKRGIGSGCEEEAMRVVKSMPHWTPGLMNGNAVRVQYILPVKFSLK
jgi:protein TonB